MKYGGQTKQRLFKAILLVFIFVTVLSLFTCTLDLPEGTAPQAGNSAMNSQTPQMLDNIQINLNGSSLKQNALASNVIYKFYGGPRSFLNTIVLIRYILCFTWLCVFAYHYFNKKTNKPLPIIAIPIGGNAPPFTIA